jgi:hypothetical protein
LFPYSTGIPSQSIREMKEIQVSNGEIKLSLLADYMILYLKDPKDSKQKKTKQNYPRSDKQFLAT